MLATLAAGDTLVVWDLDRAFRSPVDMLTCVADLRAREVDFQIVTLGIDTATEAGELVATMMAAVAQFESRIISRRAWPPVDATTLSDRRTSYGICYALTAEKS